MATQAPLFSIRTLCPGRSRNSERAEYSLDPPERPVARLTLAQKPHIYVSMQSHVCVSTCVLCTCLCVSMCLMSMCVCVHEHVCACLCVSVCMSGPSPRNQEVVTHFLTLIYLCPPRCTGHDATHSTHLQDGWQKKRASPAPMEMEEA